MQYPRVKPEHRPYQTSDDKLIIGGGVHGIAAEIADRDGTIWALLTALDGTRTVDQVASHLVHRFPELSTSDAHAAVDMFIGTGYVEDAGTEEPCPLEPQERERYSRGHAFMRWVDMTPRASVWHPQLALRAASVAIVGLGGTGSHAAWALTASGVGHLHCVEPDVVELSNLNRQLLYVDGDVGKSKLDVASERLRSLNPHVSVTGEQSWIRNANDIDRVARGADVLIVAADEPFAIRSWANEVCVRREVPWICGGYHGPLINTSVFTPGSGPCYECLRTYQRNGRRARFQEFPSTDAETSMPGTNAISAGMSGLQMAHAAIALITGAPRLPVNSAVMTNLVRPDAMYELSLDAPHPDCTACGDST